MATVLYTSPPQSFSATGAAGGATPAIDIAVQTSVPSGAVVTDVTISLNFSFGGAQSRTVTLRVTLTKDGSTSASQQLTTGSNTVTPNTALINTRFDTRSTNIAANLAIGAGVGEYNITKQPIVTAINNNFNGIYQFRPTVQLSGTNLTTISYNYSNIVLQIIGLLPTPPPVVSGLYAANKISSNRRVLSVYLV